ncbi:MAG: family 16 glycosylhydrolase, partial [Saprospiraceae bacterium]
MIHAQRLHHHPAVSRLMVVSFLLITTLAGTAQCPTLVWADEFSGTTLDLNKWTPQIGDGCDIGLCGWGNNELQYYKSENATVSGGTLKITAKKERVRGSSYTSARLRTINKGDWTYGRFEARMKLPYGQGIWPAFWMLPTDEVYGSWPQSGEIDIMELVGREPNRAYGTIHYGPAYPNNQSQGNNYTLNSGIFNDAFHTFAIEWEPGVIRWYVDDYLYSTKTSADVAPYNWPFNQRFHFLLNLAVGGNWPGNPDATTVFPQTLEVDYVRVYNGNFPHVTGKRSVANQAQGEVYTLKNVPAGSTVSWTVPAGATIASGQGTNTISVNWGNTGGDIVANVTTGCYTRQIVLNVAVEPAYAKAFSFENFDQAPNMTFISTTGTLTEDVANPAPNTVNNSALCGRYVRNSSQQYDVLQYSTTAITNASQYFTNQHKFYIDIYTNAPPNTLILLQLENSATATSSNYPTGRHSRYQAFTTVQNQWQRLAFTPLDQPDASTPNNAVNRLVFLYASNSFTGNTFHWDNFDSYAVAATNQAPTVSITAPANGATYNSLQSITISANAADADGSVAQVEFFANGNSIGTDNTAPYSINWTIPAFGSYQLTARATDNQSASTTSAAVNITASSSGPVYCAAQGTT